jgi:hypothetical protein
MVGLTNVDNISDAINQYQVHNYALNLKANFGSQPISTGTVSV